MLGAERQVGDLVMHRGRLTDRPIVARLTALQRTGLEISFLGDVKSTVSLVELYPILYPTDLGGFLRAGTALRDSRAQATLRRPRQSAVRPLRFKGHLLTEDAHWWARCDMCARKSSLSKVCPSCDFVLCARCHVAAMQLPSGGLFTDLLSPELAKALLEDETWLAYKAQAYFFKADHNSTGFLDKAKLLRVEMRLAFELGVPRSELRREGKDVFLSEKEFQDFLRLALTRGLDFLGRKRSAA